MWLVSGLKIHLKNLFLFQNIYFSDEKHWNYTMKYFDNDSFYFIINPWHYHLIRNDIKDTHDGFIY